MKIERKVFELPTEEQHSLKVIEVGELKKVETKYGMKDKFTVKIEVLDQKAEESDDPILVFATFAPSLGDKATFGKFVRALGFTTDDGSFDTDQLLGFRFTSYIAHKKGTNGNTYANLVIDTAKAQKQGKSAPAPKAAVSEEEIPF